MDGHFTTIRVIEGGNVGVFGYCRAVKVKWGKEKYDVELSTEETPEVFKGQLFALTGVPPERQKVMLGGVTVGDTEWGKSEKKIKNVCVCVCVCVYVHVYMCMYVYTLLHACSCTE